MKTWTWLRKGNLERETESLLIGAENNAIRTNHIKIWIDKTQQNCKCGFCGDRDETTNHIISECSKLAQKEYKTRYYWVSKVIHWEMCKKFKFDHANRWYMHNPASVLGMTHKLLYINEWPYFGQKTRPNNYQQQEKKKRKLPKLRTLHFRFTTE